MTSIPPCLGPFGNALADPLNSRRTNAQTCAAMTRSGLSHVRPRKSPNRRRQKLLSSLAAWWIASADKRESASERTCTIAWLTVMFVNPPAAADRQWFGDARFGLQEVRSAITYCVTTARSSIVIKSVRCGCAVSAE